MNVLGISCEHDAGAALVANGDLLLAVNEERLCRKKFPVGLPSRSIEEVIALSDVTSSDIDVVACGSRVHVDNLFWGGGKSFRQVLIEHMSVAPCSKYLIGKPLFSRLATELLFLAQSYYRKRITQMLRDKGIGAPVKFIDHHYSHACSAYYLSGWNECLVVTLDAQGDGSCSNVYLGKNGKLRLLHSIPFFHSPGYYYMYVTMMAGFKYGQDGKITGMAAYGTPGVAETLFKKRIVYDEEAVSFKNKGFYLEKEVNVLKEALKEVRIEDISAGMQSHMEDIVAGYMKDLMKRYSVPENRLALAGGIFANVKVTKRIAEIKEVGEIFIFPHMGDGGLAVGAAMAESGKDTEPPKPLNDLYLGRAYSDEEILKAINKRSLRFKHSENIESEIALKLKEKKIIGRFVGRMEYGPRALGNRSIFLSPKYKGLVDLLNLRLKRDAFMPFAPAILRENAKDYLTFDEHKVGHAMEFMTIACNVTERCKEEAPAAVHVDGTARPQLVSREVNPSLYKVLEYCRDYTGTPIAINTSFNKHEEPIVFTPDDAIDMFEDGSLDILAINNYLIER